jgi:mono/diheme cytochrome c family protein
MSKKKHNNPPERQSAGSVTGMHPAGSRSLALTAETPEPAAQDRPVPVALIIFTLVFLYYADMYVMKHGADVGNAPKTGGAFPALVYDPYETYEEVLSHNPVDPTQVAKNEGKKVFSLICAGCHQASGQGVAGQFPPLAGSEWVLEEGPNRIIRVVMNGLSGPITVKGSPFGAVQMLPWKDALTDEQIANVLTYVRSEWGNNAPPVTAAQVKKVRDQVASRAEYWTAPELQKVPAKD